MDLPTLKTAIIESRKKWHAILSIATHKEKGPIVLMMSRRCGFCHANVKQPMHLGSPFANPSTRDLATKESGLCENILFFHSGECPVKQICHEMTRLIWKDEQTTTEVEIPKETIALLAKKLLKRMAWLWEEYDLEHVVPYIFPEFSAPKRKNRNRKRRHRSK